MCILIVEDEDLIRTIMAEELAEAGHEVLEIADGAAALAVMRTEGERFHLLVTDVHMPGATGIEVAAAFRQRHPDAPVIFMTGYPGSLNGQISERDNARLLRKPFTPNELTATVEAVLLPGACSCQDGR